MGKKQKEAIGVTDFVMSIINEKVVKIVYYVSEYTGKVTINKYFIYLLLRFLLFHLY